MDEPNSTKIKIQEIVKDLVQLPSLPMMIAQLMDKIKDPKSSVPEVAHIIESDMAIASKLLRLANSAFYGIPNSISSINNAIVLLGFNVIRSLALSAVVVKLFPDQKQPPVFQREKFWKHAICCGLAAKILAKHIRKYKMVDSEEAFCAGLMHDIGKLVLEQFLHFEFDKAINESISTRTHLFEAEKKIIGVDHTEVSELLLKRWNFPLELLVPITCHHAPEKASISIEMTYIVHMADIICHGLGINVMDNEVAPPTSPRVMEILSLTEEKVEELGDQLNDAVKEAQDIFKILHST